MNDQIPNILFTAACLIKKLYAGEAQFLSAAEAEKVTVISVKNTETDTQAYVQHIQGTGIVSITFPGTESIRDVLTDIQYDFIPWEGIDKVHRGFSIAASSVLPGIISALDTINPVYIAINGHSLGAALAEMVGFALRKRGYNAVLIIGFEPPRWTDKAGSEAFSKLIGADSYRTQNEGDFIPHLPFADWGYCQVGNELRFNNDGSVVFNGPEMVELSSKDGLPMLAQKEAQLGLSICPPSHSIDTVISNLESWINSGAKVIYANN